MADFFGKLVIRASASPKRRAWLLGSAGVLAALLLYGAFELGRYDAGYRVVDSVRGAWASSSRARELEAENARLRNDLTAADVGRRIDRESYKQVQSSVGDMQSQIARLTQDLSFYRGLVQPDSLVHVKVQQMQIVPVSSGRYQLKFVLMQTGKPDNTVWGTMAVAVQGLTGGKPQTLKFGDVSVDRRAGLAYSFRYFEDYDEAVQLPPGFEPTRIDVELYAAKDSTHAFRQAFVWKAQGMSVETEASGEAKEKSDVQTESE
jgi:outer membrane murein-binding lipoprotein Lpp